MCVCVFSSHSFWTSSSLDVPAGVTQEERRKVNKTIKGRESTSKCVRLYVCVYVCVYVCSMLITFSILGTNRVRLPILLVVS